MSMSARKRRTRREVHRIGTKKYRAAVRRALRGGKMRGSHFSTRYGHMGILKESTIPIDGGQ